MGYFLSFFPVFVCRVTGRGNIIVLVASNLSKRFKLGIVTGRPKRDADYTIDKYGLRRYFSAIITLDDVSIGKPDPEGIRKAMDLLRTKDAAYFGDTVDDIDAGKKADILPVGVLPPLSSSNTSKRLLDSGAAIVLENINRLGEVI